MSLRPSNIVKFSLITGSDSLSGFSESAVICKNRNLLKLLRSSSSSFLTVTWLGEMHSFTCPIQDYCSNIGCISNYCSNILGKSEIDLLLRYRRCYINDRFWSLDCSTVPFLARVYEYRNGKSRHSCQTPIS